MSSTLESGLSASPYPGLRPFRRDEGDIFFGREEQVDQLLAKLESSRFLAVVGVSGCGKSSLVRAGMLSALAGGFLASAGPRWHVIEMRPGGHPLANLARALLRGETLGGEWQSRPDADAFVRAVLRRGPLGLVELLREALRPLPEKGTGPLSSRVPSPFSGNNLLVLVDQFEEIFRFHKHGDANEATAFVDLLLESSRQQEVPIFVVLTMRSDFLGDCSLFAGLPEAINEGQFLIPRLTREQCRAAVAGPAAAFGANVEPELVNHVLNDIGSNPDQLPLMQHALMRVWNRAVAGVEAVPAEEANGEVTLTLAAYQAVGGLKHALSDHADELYEKLAPDDRRVAEVLFRCLSERGADGRDIRRPVRLDAVAEVTQVPAETVLRIVEVFREPTCSFLTPPAGVPLQADSVLDISHESLIRQWRRMAEWVQAEADSGAIFRRLSGTAVLWQAGQAALWTTPDLENALCWREREQPTAAWAARYGGRFAESMAFLEASVAARDRQLRAEQERQERERELLQNMARAEKQRADAAEERRREQAQANRQLRRRALAALVAGALATVLAGVAFVLFAHARAEQRRANEAAAEAERDRRQADEARMRADQFAAQEAASRVQAQERSFAALQSLARANLAQLRSLWTSTQPGRQQNALKLLRDSAKLCDTGLELARNQDTIPRDVAQQSWRRFSSQVRNEAVRWLSLSSLQKIHEIPFEDRTTGPNFGSVAPFQARCAWSPDTNRLAVVAIDAPTSKRELRLVDALSGNIIKSQSLDTVPLALGFTGDGATLLVASMSPGNSAIVVEHRSATDLNVKGKPVSLPVGNLPFYTTDGMHYYSNSEQSYWFDRLGAHFVSAAPAGTMVWEAASGMQLFDEKFVEAVGMTGGGNHLVLLVNQVRYLRIVDLKSRKTLREFPLSDGGVRGSAVFVSPDGKWLALESLQEHGGVAGSYFSSGGTYYHTLHLFDLTTGQKTAEVRLPRPRNFFSSDTLVKAAFHPTRPLLTVSDGQYVWLLSVPRGGILHEQRVSDTPETDQLVKAAYRVQFSQRGDLLMTALHDSPRYGGATNQAKFVAQFWDPSVASEARQTLGAGGDVQDLCFARDDALAVASAGAGADTGTVQPVGANAKTGVQFYPLQGPGQWATESSRPSGAFEPSGKHYVRILPERFEIYDAATGQRRQSIARKWPGLQQPLEADGTHRWLVGVDRSGAKPRLRLFDATNLRWTATLLDAASVPNRVQFDGRSVYVVIAATRTSPPAPGRPAITSMFVVAYRLADGAKVSEIPMTSYDWRVTDAGYLLSGSFENNAHALRAHDLQTGRLVSSHPSNSSVQTNYHFWLSRDGKSAAFLTQDGSHRLWLWPFGEGKEPRQLPIECNQPQSLALVGDRLLLAGYLIATPGKARATSQWATQLWDVQSDKLLATQLGSNLAVIETYGKGLVSPRWWNSNQPTCAVWDMKTGQVLGTFSDSLRGSLGDMPFRPDANAEAVSPDGRFVLFASGKVLDLATMKVRSAPQGMPPSPNPFGGGVAQARFSPDSRYLVLSSNGSRVRVLDLHNPEVEWTPAEFALEAAAGVSPGGPVVIPAGRAPVAEFSPDGRLVGFIDPEAPDRLHLYSLATRKKLRTIVIRRGNYRPDQPALAPPQLWFSAEGTHVAAVVSDQLLLGNVAEPQVHTALPRTGHVGAVHALALSPDGRFLASAGADATVCFWRVTDGRFLGMLDLGGSGPLAAVRRVAFSRRGNLIATRQDSGETTLWKWSRPDGDDAEVAAACLWSSPRGKGSALAFSADGAYLALGETDGGIRLLHADNGRLVHWLKPVGGSFGAVQSLSFSPDGKHLAAARGRVIALWDNATGTPGRAWDAGQGPIHDFAYSDDGRFLVSGGRDARLWDASTGALVLKLDQESSAVRLVALSPSGRRLAAAIEGRSLVVTDVTELIAAVNQLGLQQFPDASQPLAWREPLWAPESAEKIAAENTLAEFEPRAARAEQARDWKMAVAHLTRLLAVEPDNAAWRQRRIAAYERLHDWPAAAADRSYLLDRTNNVLTRASLLVQVSREKREVFAALEKLRPTDPALALARAQELIRRSKWQDARTAYASCVRALPVCEGWFEYAGLCLLTGDRKAYEDHLAWMAQQEGQLKNEVVSDYFVHYARAAGLAAHSRPDQARLVQWADSVLARYRYGPYPQTAALLYCRAGQFDKAREALKAPGGNQSLNWLILGIVESKQGNHQAARDLLGKARAWRDGLPVLRLPGGLDSEKPIPDSVTSGDWIEFHVLMPELEALVASGPQKKPGLETQPKR